LSPVGNDDHHRRDLETSVRKDSLMATAKSGIKATKKKTTSIRKGATVGRALTGAAKAVTRKAKRVVAASKKKPSMTRSAKKTTAKKSMARKG
jgi:hypothetical protein